ncbi:MAG: O-antigen ligase family protein [Verrucomicrobia bacterium]|nr:O-antigen ligase family protein [Verrucomicrobiota bacterium]
MRTPDAYERCDTLTQGVLFFMVVFGPWAFGTTRSWAIWTMNTAGYTLGCLLAMKWWIRWRTGFRPARWGEEQRAEDGTTHSRHWGRTRKLTVALAGLTLLILAYALTSALNARATFDATQLSYSYRESISWLPQSYDQPRSWFAFWQLLGLACAFWSVRDWLLGKARAERQQNPLENLKLERGGSAGLPLRLRRLLWLLAINGALLAVEGILQRLDGTGKLLWLREPLWNKTSDSQFGPYAYRSNAAQYFNLVWPLALALGWQLHRAERSARRRYQRIGEGPHLLLLPFAVLMAACPIISTSRGGAFVSVGNALLAFVIFLAAVRRDRWRSVLGIAAVFIMALGLGGFLGWSKLRDRLNTPIFSYPLDYDIGANDLTLRITFRVPADAPKFSQGLLGLSPDGGYLLASRHALSVFIHHDGGLRVRFLAASPQTYAQRSVFNFTERFHGQMVTLTVVKSSELSIFVNGSPVSPPPSNELGGQTWDAPVASAHFMVGRLSAGAFAFPGEIRNASFFNYALPEDEIKRLDSVEQAEGFSHPGFASYQSDFSEGPNGFVAAAAGVQAVGAIDRGNDLESWLEIRRAAGRGALAARLEAPPIPLLAGQTARLSGTLFNPQAEPARVGVGWDDDLQLALEVAANTETNFSAFFKATHACSNLVVAVTDSSGQVRRDRSEGENFSLKNFVVESLGAVKSLDYRKAPRRRFVPEDMTGRTTIYRNARKMAREFPVFGTGPATFASIYRMYRETPRQEWAAYAHDDWLETRITYGWVGFGLFTAAFVLVVLHWFGNAGIPTSRLFAAMLGLSLLGCLVHARFDFPFQIHSVAFLFVLVCALLCSCSRKS